ncbi:aminoglycoside phosphotransferase [Streptomyces sp. NPDC004111]|uniref:aminoglycoside phosphotransferase n=1 Tax=Streptomyces sp. NPDC004111 TaxID=3364690 RepID=UPI0036C8A5EC
MTEPPSTPPNTVPIPSRAVLDAFRVPSDGPGNSPVPLSGGQGRSVLVGGYVFKPAEGAEEEAEWGTAVWEELVPNGGFRVPRPLRAADGRCVVDGWTASEFLPGEPGPQGHWDGVLAAGRAFHAALKGVPRPAFLDRRTHPWAVADRVAWGERDIEAAADLAAPLAALREAWRPVNEEAAQLIHGDLTGNVLFGGGGGGGGTQGASSCGAASYEPPTVIDFSPYWRPPLFAEAVVVVDGLLWFDRPAGLLTDGGAHPDWPQLLIRALIFRLVAQSELAAAGGLAPGEWERERERYEVAADAVVRMARRGPGDRVR